jgi:transcriptional regulator with XRE-family HTH domain
MAAKTKSAGTPGHAALVAAPPVSVKEFRQKLGLTRKEFARLSAVSERAVAAWEADQAISPANRKSLRESERLCAALMRIMKPSYVGRWLDAPNQAFSGLKPLDLIERGELDRLWRMVYEVESGALT